MVKIIHMSDIHGDFETLDTALKYVEQSDADILAVTGDLVGRVLDEKNLPEFEEAANFLMQVYRQTDAEVDSLDAAAEMFVDGKIEVAGVNGEKLAERYLDLEIQAKIEMKKQYRGFKDIFDDLGKKVLLVPGNWDGKCIDDFLAFNNLHNKNVEQVNGISFVGYGGASVFSGEIPVDLIVRYNEDEMFHHLSAHEEAEVALMHTPPYGFENSERHNGSKLGLAYMFRNTPSLILAGHTHKPLLARESKTKVWVSNSGNLGRYQNSSYGTFFEIELDDNTFVNPLRTYQVVGDEVKVEDIENRS